MLHQVLSKCVLERSMLLMRWSIVPSCSGGVCSCLLLPCPGPLRPALPCPASPCHTCPMLPSPGPPSDAVLLLQMTASSTWSMRMLALPPSQSARPAPGKVGTPGPSHPPLTGCVMGRSLKPACLAVQGQTRVRLLQFPSSLQQQQRDCTTLHQWQQ